MTAEKKHMATQLGVGVVDNGRWPWIWPSAAPTIGILCPSTDVSLDKGKQRHRGSEVWAGAHAATVGSFALSVYIGRNVAVLDIKMARCLSAAWGNRIIHLFCIACIQHHVHSTLPRIQVPGVSLSCGSCKPQPTSSLNQIALMSLLYNVRSVSV